MNNRYLTGSIKYILMRISVVSLLATLVLLFVELIFVDRKVFARPVVYLFAIVAFNIVSEGNILINRYFEKKEPWVFRVSGRIIKQVTISLVWTSLVGILFYYLIPRAEQNLEKYTKGFILIFTFGALFVLIYNSILFIQRFIANWKISMLENEKLKHEKLMSDYTALQNQLNPHFLFNNLSVLISEIRYAPERAEEFARKMADIYRYVLQSKDKTLVTVAEELKFIENYIFLHNIRLGDAVKLEIMLSDDRQNKTLPPLTLQLLVENALKHNKASEKEPLNISIFMENDNLVVSNNLQLKKTTYGTGTGLKNLNERYKLLYGKEIRIEKTEDEFRVVLPME
ncbi:MAG: histidine kinase [Chlorobi bacterium]|nr:histidine kinase [Chlorobiota bacterium]